jgi:hypothetical protein
MVHKNANNILGKLKARKNKYKNISRFYVAPTDFEILKKEYAPFYLRGGDINAFAIENFIVKKSDTAREIL